MTENEEKIHFLDELFYKAARKLPAIFDFARTQTEEDEDLIQLVYTAILVYGYGDTKQEHTITLEYDLDTNLYGIEIGREDGDYSDITPENIMIELYFDLAFNRLDSKYLRA